MFKSKLYYSLCESSNRDTTTLQAPTPVVIDRSCLDSVTFSEIKAIPFKSPPLVTGYVKTSPLKDQSANIMPSFLNNWYFLCPLRKNIHMQGMEELFFSWMEKINIVRLSVLETRKK